MQTEEFFTTANNKNISTAIDVTEQYSYGGTLSSEFPSTSARARSVPELAAGYLEYQIGNDLTKYVFPFIIVVGAFGNTVSFGVMVLKHNRAVSCCAYMAALALSDNMVLLIAAHYWMMVYVVPRGFAYYECKVSAYLLQVFSLYSIILVVAMTVDRFVAVRFPLRAASLCRPGRARVTIAVSLAVSLLYNIPQLFSAKPLGKACAAFSGNDLFTKVFTWLGIVFNSIVPFSIILTLNCFIISTIRRRQAYFKKQQEEKCQTDSQQKNKDERPVKSLQNKQHGGEGIAEDGKKKQNTKGFTDESEHTEQAGNKTRSKDAQLTMMLLSVTFALLFLTLPQYVRYVVYPALVDFQRNAHTYAVYILVYHVAARLYFANNAVNFFLYCVSGSRFRQDSLVVLGCGGRRGKRKRGGKPLSADSTSGSSQATGTSSRP